MSNSNSGPMLDRPLPVDERGRVVAPAGFSVADLHCHTSWSDGILGVESLLELARARGIAAVAITDHDMIGGALRGNALEVEFGIQVIVGSEVTTRRQHHIVGLFLREAIPMFRGVPETVARIREQGGLAIVAHPFLGVPASASRGALRRWFEETTFDGVELDSRYLSAGGKRDLVEFYAEHSVGLGSPVGGSDAHFRDVGRVVTLFPGKDAADLRAAMVQRRTLVARTALDIARPSALDHARNQARSLLWLPLYRARALLIGRYR